MHEHFSKSIFWIWIIGSDCKLKLAQIPEKPQKSLFVEKTNKFCKKKSENWIAVNLEFSLRRKQIRKNRKTEFLTFWRF